MENFAGKVAVITGGASGIGRGIAEYCGKHQMKVVLADVEDAALRETEKRLKGMGAPALAIRVDVSRLTDIERLASKTMETFGGVHLLFNNAGAGVHTRAPTWEGTQADWEWVINVNLWGVINGIRTFVPLMLRQQSECHIVNTASIAGLISSTNNAIYRVTKTAIVSLTETLYLELQQRGSAIGVSVLCPGIVRSRLNEAERNRPGELSNPPDHIQSTPEAQAMEEMFHQMNERGMTPEQCAELVFQAIREKRFYILPHPEWNESIRQRMEAILDGRNPTIAQASSVVPPIEDPH
jgi:NAD(P)-dependent dehydrogenase (short-subunit alcohol dehydrogenase family)